MRQRPGTFSRGERRIRPPWYPGLRRGPRPGSGVAGRAHLVDRRLPGRGQLAQAAAEQLAIVSVRALERGAAHEALAMRFGLCGYHHHDVQACLEAGQVAEARVSADEGIALARRLGGHMVLPGLLAQRAELLATAGEEALANDAILAGLETARGNGSAFFELLALAAAQRLRTRAADLGRLHELLALYQGDPSPRIAEIRGLTSGAP